MACRRPRRPHLGDPAAGTSPRPRSGSRGTGSRRAAPKAQATGREVHRSGVGVRLEGSLRRAP